jgi:hypothetical protein
MRTKNEFKELLQISSFICCENSLLCFKGTDLRMQAQCSDGFLRESVINKELPRHHSQGFREFCLHDDSDDRVLHRVRFRLLYYHRLGSLHFRVLPPLHLGVESLRGGRAEAHRLRVVWGMPLLHLHKELLLSFGFGESLPMHVLDVLGHIDESANVLEACAGVLFKAHDEHLLLEALVHVHDGVVEISITGEESDGLHLAAERVIDQVDSDGHVDLGLDLPLDLLLAATAADLRAVFEITFIYEDVLYLTCLLETVIEPSMSRSSFGILGSHEANLVEFTFAAERLQVPEEVEEVPRDVQGQSEGALLVQLVDPYLQIGSVDDQHIL